MVMQVIDNYGKTKTNLYSNQTDTHHCLSHSVIEEYVNRARLMYSRALRMRGTDSTDMTSLQN